MELPEVVSAEEWQAARDRLLVKEKEATRVRDALAAERRRLPMVRIDKEYVFDGRDGKRSLFDLFEGRRQLIVYHFMFAPDVEGWPDAGCPGCSMIADHIGRLEHLHARDTTLAFVSLAPLANIERYRERMGWTSFPWYSSDGTDFNTNFGVTSPDGETFGVSVFIRDSDDVYRTYFTNGRGGEVLENTWTFLDFTPLGRQETWEDSPPGYPQTPPYEWWRRHERVREGLSPVSRASLVARTRALSSEMRVGRETDPDLRIRYSSRPGHLLTSPVRSRDECGTIEGSDFEANAGSWS